MQCWFISLMKVDRLPNLVPLQLDIGSFFLSYSKCHPQKLKSLRNSPKVLELESNYRLFYHKTSLQSGFQPRFSILGRDGGLEVFSKIFKFGTSYKSSSI